MKTYFATEVVESENSAQPTTELQSTLKLTWSQLLTLNQGTAAHLQGAPVSETVVQCGNFAPVWADSANGRVLYLVPKKLSERGKDPRKIFTHLWLNTSDLSWKIDSE